MASINHFYITAWLGVDEKYLSNDGITLNKERLLEVKESGIDLIPLTTNNAVVAKQALCYCAEIGLKITLIDKRVNKAIKEKNRSIRLAILKELVDEYSQYEALGFYYLYDEPSYSLFADLAEVRNILHSLDPNHECYSNIFPNFASSSLLQIDYETYVKQYIEQIKPAILSYDHYHFLKEIYEKKDAAINERDRLIFNDAFEHDLRPGFYNNLEIIKRICDEKHVPFMLIVLVVEHGPYRYLNKNEILFENNAALAYGAKQLSYFTYWTPGADGKDNDELWHWRGGMIEKDGSRSSHYYDVKEINLQLRPIIDYIFPLQNISTLHIGKEKDEGIVYYHDGLLKDISIKANNLIIGVYEDEHYYLVNKDCVHNIAIDIESKRDVLVFINGQFVISNKSIILAPGDAVLIKIK